MSTILSLPAYVTPQHVGELSVNKFSDVSYTLHFKYKSTTMTSDIDDITFNRENGSVTMKEEDAEMIVFASDAVDFNTLLEITRECQEICFLTLRIKSVVRDVYFAGLYSRIHPFQNLSVTEEIQNLGLQADDLLTAPRSSSTNSKARRQYPAIDSPLQCIYCDCKASMDPTAEFIVHPFVSRDHESRVVYLCMTCTNNWKDYRDKAERDGELILDGEVNEEVCSVCSNTPSELVLCCVCPRSFCQPCLLKVLGPVKGKKVLASDDDWTCVCCVAQLPQTPDLRKEAWIHARSEHSKKLSSSSTSITCLDRVRVSSNATDARLSAAASGRNPNCGRAGSIWSDNEVAALRRAIQRAGGTFNSSVMQDQEFLSALEVKRTQSSIYSKGKGVERLMSGVSIIEAEQSSSQADEDNAQRRRTVKPNRFYNNESLAATASSSGMPLSIVAPLPNGQAQSSSSSSSAAATATAKHAHAQSLAQAATAAATSTSAKPPSAVIVTPASSKRRGREEKGDELPPVNKLLDEVYYFGQYVSYYDSICAAADKGQVPRATDDFCFLCKDGGDLIECDFRGSKKSKKKCRCKKVYHEYCLSYSVPENIKWNCPRHYCDTCGSESIVFVCKYCPTSICAQCPEKFVTKSGYSQYLAVRTPPTEEFDGPIQVIVCQHCIESVDSCVRRSELPASYKIEGKEMSFPSCLPASHKPSKKRQRSNSSTAAPAPASSSSASSAATVQPSPSKSVIEEDSKWTDKEIKILKRALKRTNGNISMDLEQDTDIKRYLSHRPFSALCRKALTILGHGQDQVE